jgi:hypothetical protein
MDATTSAEEQLNVMLDEGVHAAIEERTDDAYVLRIRLDDASCEDCLVPDETLIAITRDALERGGATVRSLTVEHAGVQGS